MTAFTGILHLTQIQPSTGAKPIDVNHLINDLGDKAPYLDDKNFSDWTNYFPYITAIATMLACYAIGRRLMLKQQDDLISESPKDLTPTYFTEIASEPPSDLKMQRILLGAPDAKADHPLPTCIASENFEEMDANLSPKDLFNAVVVQDLNTIRKILTSVPKEKSLDFINYVDDNGTTPLHQAVCLGDEEIVSLLLEKGADCNIQDNNGTSPLMIATCENNASIVQLLLKREAKVEFQTNDEKATALHFAVDRDNSKIVKSMLESPSKENFINLKEGVGKTALYIATVKKNVELVEMLLNHGADANLSDNNGITPLAIANDQGQHKTFKMLLEKSNQSSIDSFYEGATPLFSAVCSNEVFFVESLVKHGANMNKPHQTLNNETPFMRACFLGNLVIVKFLLNKDPQKKFLSCFDKDRRTALYYAINSGKKSVVDELLHAGENLMHTNKLGFTPLMVAVMNNKVQIVEKILKYDHDKCCPNDRTMSITALELAQRMGHTPIVNLIEKHLNNSFSKNNNQITRTL